MEGDAFNGLMSALSVVMNTPMFDTTDVLQDDSVVKEEEVELNDMNEDVKQVEEDAQVRVLLAFRVSEFVMIEVY